MVSFRSEGVGPHLEAEESEQKSEAGRHFEERVRRRNEHNNHEQQDLSDGIDEFPVKPVWSEALVQDEKVFSEFGFVELRLESGKTKDADDRNSENNEEHGEPEEAGPQSVSPFPTHKFQVKVESHFVVN